MVRLPIFSNLVFLAIVLVADWCFWRELSCSDKASIDSKVAPRIIREPIKR